MARVKVPKDGSFEVVPEKGADGGKKEESKKDPVQPPDAKKEDVKKDPMKPPDAKTERPKNEEAKEICDTLASNPPLETKKQLLSRLEQVRPDLYPHVVAICLDKAGSHSYENAIQSLRFRGALPTKSLLMKRLSALAQDSKSADSKFDYQIIQQINTVLVTLSAMAPDDPAVIAEFGRGTEQKTKIQHLYFMALRHCVLYEPTTINQVWPFFLKGLKNKELYAVIFVGQLGPPAKEALPLLTDLRLEGNAEFRNAVSTAIRAVEGKKKGK